MEWFFNGLHGLENYPPACPKDKLKELTTLLLTSGYTPYAIDHYFQKVQKLNTSVSDLGTEWVLLDVLWLQEKLLPPNSTFLTDFVQPGYYTESFVRQHFKVPNFGIF